MRQYLELLRTVLGQGDPQYNERTGQLMLVRSRGQIDYDLREGFPMVTTKASAPLRWVGEEMFWMLRGERNAKTLYDKDGVDIWNRNAYDHYLKRKGLSTKILKNTPEWESSFLEYQQRMKSDPNWNMEDSDLGPVYGWQWRHWTGKDGKEVDQVAKTIKELKERPGSRYQIWTAWNPAENGDMALAPCHSWVQFTVTRNRDLDLHMFQRSTDVFLGDPFNNAQYGLVGHMVAQETGLKPRIFTHSYGNVHIYAGVSPRSNFLANETNLAELQRRVKGATQKGDYLEIRDWYLRSSPDESLGNERKDHVPFVLEQLSKEPQPLPRLQLANMPFFELIERPAREVMKLEGYAPLKWDSKATMAA
ncbi:MAG TPA: thymidylate synthase [Candidatus Nanoarchaeia archaeon]|nr:thymidylate synthase [Candidatus Nanoarchaeia archaeon]